ncbi:MAG: HAD-IIA family hydrolase [Actinomycetota bacterium]|nr:HAD-IIA family hydrolase [Actinomycetota bacterium]
MSVGDFDVLFFDLDGVVYIGAEQVHGAAAAIESAREQGARCIFVTNNASRTPDEVARHLSALGVPADPDDVITASMAGATLVTAFIETGEVLAVGGEGVSAALLDRGFTPVTAFTDSVRAVMQGYGPNVGWHDLAEATFAVRAGLPWVATNMDSSFPTIRGIAPGNGSLVNVVAQTAGRGPDAIAGKPEPGLLQEAIRRTGALRPLMIGDRLDTDIAAGSRLGMPTLLVTTGISTLAEAMDATGELRPTYVAENLSCLLPDRHFLAVP